MIPSSITGGSLQAVVYRVCFHWQLQDVCCSDLAKNRSGLCSLLCASFREMRTVRPYFETSLPAVLASSGIKTCRRSVIPGPRHDVLSGLCRDLAKEEPLKHDAHLRRLTCFGSVVWQRLPIKLFISEIPSDQRKVIRKPARARIYSRYSVARIRRGAQKTMNT